MKREKTLLVLLFCIFFIRSFSTNTKYLTSLINDCENLLNVSFEGNSTGEYSFGSKETLQNAINAANFVLNDKNATQQNMDNATELLFDAYTIFTKSRYGITDPNWSDNYWQFVSDTSRWGPYNLHDPSIIKTNGYYYVFSTDAAWANESKGIPVRRSRDLVHWEFRGWAFNGFPTEPTDWFKLQQPPSESPKAVVGLWAPYIIKVGNQYRMYYSAIFETSGALIGLAVSDDIEGPWTQVGKVINTYDMTNVNAIDPTVSIDKNGRHWMIYGSWSAGIYCFELDPATGMKKNATSPILIARNGPNAYIKSAMEGPEVIYNPDFNKYYLFLAQGSLGNVYHTRVARADNPYGPYYDYFGNNVAYSGASSTYQVYPLITYPYQFNNHAGWQGVSHVGVFSDGHDFYMMHQGRPSAVASMMVLHNRKIVWTDNGWPTVLPERYANPGIMPAITAESIVGDWEEILINELKDANGNVISVLDDNIAASTFLNTSTPARYGNNSYIYGNESGKWNLSRDTIITTRANHPFKAIVSYEYDWENHRTTLVYTGIRYDGRAVWGKKLYKHAANNLVLNSYFDNDLDHWIIDKYGGDFIEDISGTAESGKSFHVKSLSPATNYWSRQIRWLFPVPQCGRYKVSFKIKAATATSNLNFEVQDNFNIIPIIRTGFSAGTTEKTISFITNDVPITSNQYTMNIQYGLLEAGNEIWIDNITIDEITEKAVDNYITNGNFTDGLNGWTIKKFGQFNGSASVDSTVQINQKPTVRLKITTGTSYATNAGLAWNVYLYAGVQHVLTFDATSQTGINIAPRMLHGSSIFSTLKDTVVHSGTGSYRFIFPYITTSGNYTVEVDFGKSNSGTEAWLNNFKLLRCMEGDCSLTALNNIIEKNVQIYPNPATDEFSILSETALKNVLIYDISGKLVKQASTPYTNPVKISDLYAGLYIVKIETVEGCAVRKLIITNKH
ncbi:MAG: family 43 glycosylhydrolase [Paludibacteraceae bacterium]